MATVGQRVGKFFHADVIPTSVGRKIRLWHVAPFILAVMITAWVSGIRFSWGTSMSDTLRGIYRFERGKNPEIGQIVVFKQPNRSFRTILWPSAKRVVRMSEDGIELRGDDYDRAEDSTDFGLVPKENIIGTIVWVSASSGFDRWLKLNEPHWWRAKRAETSDYIIFELGDSLDVVSKTEEKRLIRLKGEFVEWGKDVLVYRSESQINTYDPKTGVKSLCQSGLIPVKSGEQIKLVIRNGSKDFFGPTYVLVGKSLPEGAKLRLRGRTFKVTIYVEVDYFPGIGKPTSSFCLTPRDDSVPSGTITATVVSG